MTQTLEDMVSRLEQMVEKGQQTWDLSKNDQEAISLAVRLLAAVRYLDCMPAYIESGPLAGGGLSVCVGMHEAEAESHLAALSLIGEQILADEK